MKIITKMFTTAVPAGKIVFLMAAAVFALLPMACDNAAETTDNNSNDTNGPTHFEGVLKVSNEQVWLQNKEAKRQSDEWYYKFQGEDTAINVFAVYSLDDHNEVTSSPAAWKQAGSGNINKGILNFQVEALNEENLVNTDSLKNYIFKEYDNVTIDPPDVMSNNILIETSDGANLNREGLFLKYSSIGVESVLYVFVNKDCRITGAPIVKTWGQGSKPYYSRTEDPIDISLQQGWNTLYRTEVFDRESGYDNVSMGISNPNNFKWVLYQ